MYGPKPKPRGLLQPGDIAPWDCMKCGESKPVSEYYEHHSASYGFSKKCKTCCSAACREYRQKKGRDHFRWQKMLVNFNLTKAGFEELFAAQGSKCGMCPRTEPGGGRSWHVDHDHSCCPEAGKSCGNCVRGILCHNCNLVLGHAGDSQEVLRNGIRYLGGGQWRGRQSSAATRPLSTESDSR